MVFAAPCVLKSALFQSQTKLQAVRTETMSLDGTAQAEINRVTMNHDIRPAPRGGTFRLRSSRQNGCITNLTFSCERFGEFEEEVDFGVAGDIPQRLLNLLHVALGVSTYKANAAGHVLLPALTPAGRRMAEALYTDGLAEFFVRAGLPFPPAIRFEGEVIDPARADGSPGKAAPIVAFGGGKDSYVAGVIAAQAGGPAPRYASVVLSSAVEDVLTRTAPEPPLFIRRSLDPKLLSLKGGFTGHVPITAINILVLTIRSLLEGGGPAVFANERSADEPTMEIGGHQANHQYSKSSAFEALVRDAIAEAAPAAALPFSAVRPFSELWIARAFARIPEAFPRFTSCNRNFRLAGDAEKRWCGRCPKCAFTSLILSPFITRQEHLTIFSRVMFDEEALAPFYRELCGLADQKPWECVGTISESQAAVHLLGDHDDWADRPLVRELHAALLDRKSEDELARQVDEAFEPQGRGHLPENIYEAALRFGA
jgi:hypothetical protein